ncbi:caspase family protein [Maribacter sp. 2304DJ31-5]|uniref:caspase family protein n=1 Tax=Maribacter sp. 2304DJ31-5 TaxID=3386273 RepID=UPI0039BC3C32
MRFCTLIISLFFFVQGNFSQKVKLGVPMGHNNKISSVSFSPDDKLVLTSSWDNTAKIWSSESGYLLHSLNGHSNFVKSAKFSQNGDKILTCSWDNTAKLWDTKTGALIWTMIGHENAVNSVNFSPNEKFVITASNDFTAKVWDLDSRELLFSLDEGHTSFVTSAKFSPNGDRLVSAAKDGSVVLWDFNTRKLIKKFGHIKWVRSVEFSPNGKLLLTSSWDSTSKLWDATNGNLLMTYLHEDHVETAVFSNDGNYFLTASYDGARLWDIERVLPIKYFSSGIHVLNSAVFSPDYKFVLTSSSDKISIWHIDTGRERDTWQNLSSTPFSSATFSNDGKRILSSYDNGLCRIFNLESEEPVDLSSKVTTNQKVTFSKGDEYIIMHSESSLNGEISLWNFKTGKVEKVLDNEIGINVLEKSPTAPEILVGYNDGLVRIWNYETNELKLIDRGPKAINSARYSYDGNKLITASNYDGIKLWDTSSGQLIYERDDIYADFPKKFNRIDFSSNGQYIALGDKKLAILDTSTGELLNKQKDNYIYPNFDETTSVSFSKTNDFILTSSFRYPLKIWSVKSSEVVREIDARGDYYSRSAIFSPNGKQILTTSDDNTSKLWETKSGNLIETLEGHTENVVNAKYSHDGSKIMSIAEGGMIKVWKDNGEFLYNLEGHSDDIASAEFSIDDKYILTASNDGSCIIWNAFDGGLMIQKIVLNDNKKIWVNLHPSGLFNASDEAMELMYWTKGLEIIEFEQLKDRYWLPGLWEKVMKGEKLPDVRNMSELKLQPEIEIEDITRDNVTIHLKKREGGYGKVALFINGKEAINDVRPTNMDYTLNEQTFNVSIKEHPYFRDGKNEITVKASSEDGFVQGKGIKAKIIVRKKVLKQPQFFGVVIGVGDYANDQLKLKYTVNDAEAISKAMQLGAENLFSKEKTHIYKITSSGDKLPSKRNIKNIFENISADAKAEDIIVIYLSGHGITWGGERGDFYFLTSDATATSSDAYNDPIIRENTSISTSEWVQWLKDIPALKQVMIIDACGSGKAVDNLIAERDVEPSQIKAIDRMKDRTGMYIISGCTADAVSYEASVYGQGLLTYSVLQGIKGAALKEDKYIDIFTIMDYARETVPKLAEGIGGIQEPQLLVPKGGSFDIGMLKDIDKKAIPLASAKTVFVRSTLVNAEDFEDNLGLSELLNQQLSLVSNKGKSSPLVYFDSAKFPNACKISGGYTMRENDISVLLKIRCGESLKSFELKAKNKEELIENIVALVEK